MVAEVFRFVVGVDTHAASHSYAVIACPAGVVVAEETFPATTAGLARATAWIGRRTDGDLDAVLVSAEGTGSYGSVLADRLTEIGYQVVEAPTPRRERGQGKTDQLDARAAARATLALPTDRLRHRRSGQIRAALNVLATARDQMATDRTRSVNALIALVRTHDLGVDARRPLTAAQITTIAAWRTRTEPLDLGVARAEAVRLAKRIGQLDTDLAENKTQLAELTTAQAPALTALTGIGPVSAAIVLAAFSHPGRFRSEAAFASLAGASPIPASSGNTTRHRLNRGGDRRLNRALTTVIIVRMRTDAATRAYVTRRRAEGRTTKEIIRNLKRYLARQIYRTLTAENTLPQTP